ncbi:LOW QUALITY PROTEIN: hypothetical protein HID58_092618 [Brassica napus]|uniref:Ycf2 N-terminal domain-containing protein n=1 Tax=Brassica napus TaxID=3708 RepID=A0ABQ7XDS0_BRANA|nr:LOW QUALITY PROTEIN: hypothetical protein HID58_092618 [Brassica napus]
MVESKNLYLKGLLPIPMNSIGPRNDTSEESLGKKISESCFRDPKESTRVLPITKKCIMPESNWSSRWWRNWIGKKRDFCCKISNETVAGIDISFKEKDIKYLEFLFVYYMDDPIRKGHDWELFDRLSPNKRRNIINLNSGQLFEILVKDWICYLMFAFREKIPIEVEGFFKQQGAGSTIQSNDIEHVSHLFSRNKRAISLQNCAQFHMWQFHQDLFVSWGRIRTNRNFLRKISRERIGFDNVWLVNKDRFFSKVRNVSSNIQYDSTRSSFVQVTDSSQLNGSSDQFIDPFDSIKRSILWDPSFIQTEGREIESDRFPKYLLDIPQCPGYSRNRMNNHLLPEESEEFFWNSTRAIRSFSLTDGQNFIWVRILLRGPLGRKKLLKKEQDVSFVPSRRSENKRNNNYVFTKYRLNSSYFIRSGMIRKNWVRISCGNFLEDPKPKRVVFASNNIMEAVNQYRLIRNLIQIQFQYSPLWVIDKTDCCLSHFVSFCPSYSFCLSKLLLFLSNHFLFSFVSFENIPIHRITRSSNRSFLKKLKPFLLDDHNTLKNRNSDQWREQYTPFLFNKIPKWMSDSFHTRRIAGNLLINTDSYFSIRIPRSRQLAESRETIQRSSLISSFSKANRLRFLNNPHHFCFYCNKRFPFLWKSPSQYSDFTYGQSSLSCSFTTNIFFVVVRDTISPSSIESQVSNILYLTIFPQSGVTKGINVPNLSIFQFRSDPLVRRAIYSIADISGTPLIEGQRVCKIWKERINLSDSEEEELASVFNFNSNVGLIHNPCSEEIFTEEKTESLPKKCVDKGQMDRTFQRDSAFFTLSQNGIYSNIYAMVLYFDRGLDISWRILQKKIGLPQRNLISEISRSSMQSFPLLVDGYIVRTHFSLFPEPIVSYDRCSGTIRRCLEEYGVLGGNMLWGVIPLMDLKISFIDIIDLISIIPNPISIESLFREYETSKKIECPGVANSWIRLMIKKRNLGSVLHLKGRKKDDQILLSLTHSRKDGYSLLLSDNHLFTNFVVGLIVFISVSWKTLFAPLSPSPSRSIVFYRNRTILFGQIPSDKLLGSFHYSIDDIDAVTILIVKLDTELEASNYG